MADYSTAQLYDAAVAAGFTPTQAIVATAISLAEDGSRTLDATNHNTNGTVDMGPWQINSSHTAVLQQYGSPYILLNNARMARSIYLSQGWGAWATYNSGVYRRQLVTAVRAAKSTGHESVVQKLEKAAGVSAIKGLSAPLLSIVPGVGPLATLFVGSKVDNPVQDVIGEGSDAIKAGKDAVSATQTIGEFLAKLMDPSFWRRIGVGALGAILVIICIGLMVASESRKATVPIAESLGAAAESGAV